MNTDLPPASAVAASTSGLAQAIAHHTRRPTQHSRLRTHLYAAQRAFTPTADTVRAALAYLTLCLFATLLAAAYAANWRVLFL